MDINPTLTTDLWRDEFLKAYTSKTKPLLPGVNVAVEPFHCAQINDFCSISTFNKVMVSLPSASLYEKHNDLYRFQQSSDFKTMNESIFKTIRSFFMKDVFDWQTKCTQLSLEQGVIDLTISQYKCSDVLLCHDDRLEGRRIAFVWYFVDEDWSECDGGHLDLIESDEQVRPQRVVHSFLPKRNALVFFEVTNRSFHQVREVLHSSKIRWSINGWFHGPPAFEETEDPGLPTPALISPKFIEECLLHKWIHERYLNENVGGEIMKELSNNGGIIQLRHFINKGVYDELCLCLSTMKPTDWHVLGPMNARQMECLEYCDTQPDILIQCQRLFTSEAMMVLLTNFTGLIFVSALDTVESEAESLDEPQNKKCRRVETPTEHGDACEEEDENVPDFVYGQCTDVLFRRWKHGNYTCIRDCDTKHGHDNEEEESSLEMRVQLVLHIGWPDHWNATECGGALCCFEKDEDSMRFQVDPSPNTVSLYLKDERCLDFVSYLNCKSRSYLSGKTPETLSQETAFYDCCISYNSLPVLLEEESDEEVNDENGEVE